MSVLNQSTRAALRKMPRQERSAETVRIIIEAAARVLELRGGEGFTTNAVSEVAGVSPGSLYQYFPNKAALLKSLILRESNALLDEAGNALKANSGISSLKLFIAAAVRHQIQRPLLARLLDYEEATMPFDPEILEVISRAHSIVMEILERSDLPAQPDLVTASFDVIAIIRGMADAAGSRSESDSAKLETRIWRAVWGYLESEA